MANDFPITMVEKVIEKLTTAIAVGGDLEGILRLEYGALPPPVPTKELPMIFVTISRSRHPEMYAGGGEEESYEDHVTLLLVVYCYILKDGYQESFVEASNYFHKLKKFCHEQKLDGWDGLTYTSEFCEEEDASWGSVPWPGATADDIVYGISGPLLCKRRSS